MSETMGLLEIEPLELKLPYRLHSNVGTTVRVINKTNEYIAFKVLKLLKVGPKDYSIRPNHGLMKPSSHFDLFLRLSPKTETAPDIDHFRVLSVIVTENAIVNSIKDVNDIMNVPGKIAVEAVIPVAYVQNQSDQASTNSNTIAELVQIEPLELKLPLPSILQKMNYQKPKVIEEEEEEEDEGGERKDTTSVPDQNANKFEALYWSEVQKRKKIEEELAKVREEVQQKLHYTRFNYEDLKKATHDFTKSCKIGEGGFSVVYKGSLCNKVVAIKKLKFNDEKGFKEEVETLSQVKHPNIITLIGACTDKENPVLVYEYLPKGSLEDHLNCKNDAPPLPGHARIGIALDICCALRFLHSIPRVHGDLKPDNILLDSDFVSKLSDFGTCRKLEHTKDMTTPSYSTIVKGTAPYMDPDFIASGKITSWFDVYSFGVVLLRLATGKDVYNAATGMTLRDSVERAIQDGNFEKLVDVDWPCKEAPDKMAKLGLQCFEPRWRKPGRPNAASLFKSLMDIASHR